jgi:hypothetical protein
MKGIETKQTIRTLVAAFIATVCLSVGLALPVSAQLAQSTVARKVPLAISVNPMQSSAIGL